MRALSIYLLFVGIPLLGVLAVLHFGQRIRPLTSVAGTWTIEADFGPVAISPCASLVTTIKQPALSITQSGRQLVFRLTNDEKTTFDGEFGGTTLTGGIPISEKEAESLPCGGPNGVYLKAEMNSDTKPVQLDGQLVIAGCRCSPLPFKATRQQPVETNGVRR